MSARLRKSLPSVARNRSRRLLAGVSAIALLTLAACSSSSDGGGTGTTTGSTTSASESATSPTSASVTSSGTASESGTGSETTSPATSSSPAASSTATGPLTKVTADLSFPYAASNWNCIYDYGKSKGFFANHGVDPTFDAVNGSVQLISSVSAGQIDIGISAAVANVIQAVSKGAAVKIIGVQQRDSPNAVISLDSNPIKTPADLAGKRLAYSPTSLSGLSLELLLASNNIPKSSVQVVTLQPTAYATALMSKSIDGFVSYPSSAVPNVTTLGGNAVVMLLRDHGVNPVPADGYIASDKMISEHPDVLKGFLAGAHDTWAYMYAHQDEANNVAEVCAKSHVGIKPELTAAQVKLVLSGNSAQLSQSSFMAVDEKGLSAQIDILKNAGQLDNPLPATQYFTNDLLPAGQ